MNFVVVTWPDEIRWFRKSKEGLKSYKQLCEHLLEMGMPYDLTIQEMSLPLDAAKHDEITNYIESLLKVKGIVVNEAKYLTFKDIGFSEEVNQSLLDSGLLGSSANLSLVTLEEIGNHIDFADGPSINEAIFDRLIDIHGVSMLVNMA